MEETEKATEKDRDKTIEKRLEKRFRRALTTYQLIEDGDRVLVALSGGKDSLFLLEALAKRSCIFKPRFKVEAVHVRMRNISYESDSSYLQKFSENLGVKLHILETEFDPQTDRRKSPCFLCSWYRRKAIFELAQAIGCNKLALGHHNDDIMHTAIMNLMFHGQFSSMPPTYKLDKMPLTIIRPCVLSWKATLLPTLLLQDMRNRRNSARMNSCRIAPPPLAFSNRWKASLQKRDTIYGTRLKRNGLTDNTFRFKKQATGEEQK